MIPAQPYEQNDFSGGFTDDIYSNDPTQCAFNDNLLVDTNRKAFQRWGSDLWDRDNPQIPDGENPIRRLVKFVDESIFFAQHERELYYWDSSWQTLTGPTGNPAFGASEEKSHISSAEWQGHLFMADDAGGLPIKLYQDEDGIWTVRTAGLPALADTQNYIDATTLAAAISLANALKTAFLAHMDDYGILFTVDTAIGNPLLTDTRPVRTGTALDTSGIINGMFAVQISGAAAIPAGTTVIGKTGATITLSANATSNQNNIQVLFAVANSSLRQHDSLDVNRTALNAIANASDLASLLTLTNALSTYYSAHMTDTFKAIALSPGSGTVYHNWLSGFYGAPNYRLVGSDLASSPSSITATIIPPAATTTLLEVAERLDDLKQKYNWHDAAFYTHWAKRAQHPCNTAAVGFVDSGPRIQPNITELLNWVNNFVDIIDAHYADNVAHAAADAVHPVVTIDATDISSLVTLVHDIGQGYFGHQADANLGAAWAYHIAQDATGNPGVSTIANMSDPLDIEVIKTYVQNIITKYHLHDASSIAHTIGGNHADYEAAPTLATYNYSLCYRYDYQVGDVEYIDRGPVTTIGPILSCVSVTNGAAISQIPVISNGTTENYDTGAILVEVYRTEDAGNVYFLAGSITNGTTTYSDTALDETLVDGERLYTTGGEVENDPPPSAKSIHIVDEKAYYGNILENGVRLKNRVRQSIAGDPDSCPGDFFVDLADEVIGVSSAQSLPIVLCRSAIYRLEGEFDLRGQGEIVPIAIENPGSIGLVSENSIVRIEAGILFAGTDGFYFTDGYSLKKLSSRWNATYKTLTSDDTRAAQIQGSYEPTTKRVFWSAQREEGDENDAVYVLDLNFPLEQPCWTSMSNGSHFIPTSLLAWKGGLLRGDSRGYLFLHDADLLTDPYVNTDVSPLTWGTKAVIVDYISCSADFGSNAVRKWAGSLQAQFQDEDLFMAISAKNDQGEYRDLAPIRRLKTLAWGDLTIEWGEPTILWDFSGNLTRKRRFPAKTLRFTSKQVRFTSDEVLLKSSDTVPGNATVDSNAESVTLDDASYAWLSDCEGYFIAFEGDDYAEMFEIDERSSDTVLYVNDPDGLLTSGSQAWRIYGQPKNQYVRFLSWSVSAALMSQSQTGYRSEVADGE